MKIPLAGVIGHPIGHSKSPRLHGHWLKFYGISGHYVPLDVAAGDFERVLRTLPLAGFVGANVTIPHKEVAVSLADEVTERAARMGSANTLVFHPDGRISADSTDGYGFIQNIKAARPEWKADQGPAMVFGAGGAARAVIDSLLEEGVPELRLANRTRARAEALAHTFGPKVRVIDWDAPRIGLNGAVTVVNTTSLGMSGQPPFDVPLRGLQPGAIATDLVYTPLDTSFLIAAAAAGAKTVDGLGMLLHQAVPGFEAWFGQRPDVTDALRDVMLRP
ncbi:shikimate dehydrogenase [Pseudoruegeria sp. SK021]|uniref:shikimate dehydrogenase n=1 Tax=Pseudoruegeria sp. SK021 TaxID=1933035 RepID=UPI000A232F2D|nr:shikimate dehydrogenase [Pseudoruegeria sp. SK021]OSP55344.1 shikimate dehydrogenase [Pseudoruegeria sp. SK021]